MSTFEHNVGYLEKCYLCFLFVGEFKAAVDILWLFAKEYPFNYTIPLILDYKILSFVVYIPPVYPDFSVRYTDYKYQPLLYLPHLPGPFLLRFMLLNNPLGIQSITAVDQHGLSFSF